MNMSQASSLDIQSQRKRLVAPVALQSTQPYTNAEDIEIACEFLIPIEATSFVVTMDARHPMTVKVGIVCILVTLPNPIHYKETLEDE